MHSRLFAAALVSAIAVAGCQGSPGATPGAMTTPAKGMGLIKGVVTTAGVISAGGSNYAVLQAQGGAPVPGANVQIQGGAFVGEVITAADGSFSAQVPGGASYTVTASHSDGKGGLLKQVAVVEVPLADEPPTVDVASLVTRRTGSIQGVVALAGGADPEGADVFVPGTTIVGKVSAKGRFALANMPEGTWNVVVQKPGYQRAARTDLAVKAGRPLVLTDPITLEAGQATGGSLKGLIRDGQGRAIVGATVTATDAQGVGYTGTSDGQGQVSVPGLPDGTYRVQVYRSFYQVPPAQTITMAGGQGGDLGTVSLTSTVLYFGKVSGQLLDEAGAPIDGAVVQLDPPVADSVFTDSQGRFTLDRIMPGEYTLRAAAGGFEVGERDVLVENRNGFTADLGGDFTLRQPFDPAKVKSAERKVTKLLPPNVKASYQGDDLVLSWDPSGLPAGVAKVYYDLEGQMAPGAFMNLATTEQTQLILKGFGHGPASFNLVVRPVEAPAAGYRVMGASAIGSVSTGISLGSIQGMNLETAMMAVQSNRANLLEAQLKDQLAATQAKNDQIAKLNTALGNLNKILGAVGPSAKSTTPLLSAKRPYEPNFAPLRLSRNMALEANFQMTYVDWDKLLELNDLQNRIQNLKSQIDSEGNSQQMDMLRLQSLSNKRNESFDLMTNFIKKMQDSRSSIIGNMR